MTGHCDLRLVLVEPPINEPLTAAEAKARLNIGDEVPDQVMDAYITASRQMIDGPDGYLGRAINTQTWQGRLDQFPTCDGGRIYLPLPPLQTVSEISYLDPDGIAVALASGDYKVVMAQRSYLVPVSAWPQVTGTDGITIEFVAGYGDDGDDVPETIRTAIALQAGHLRSMTSRDLTISQEAEEGIGSTNYVISGNAGEAVDYTVKCLLAGYRVMFA